MRTADVFLAGAIAGALAAWLWGDELETFISGKTREVRAQTADAIETVADTVRA
jgi:hypothetical protein